MAHANIDFNVDVVDVPVPTSSSSEGKAILKLAAKMKQNEASVCVGVKLVWVTLHIQFCNIIFE